MHLTSSISGHSPSLFRVAWDNAVVPSNIKIGFRECGIHPLNPIAVHCSAFAPSIPTDTQAPAREVIAPSTSALLPVGKQNQLMIL
ncbi:hypothetical protein DPMN_007773 [Dreissena polymorpha]|uniref:Uncharacterized protein n=1 Tax=Dreissena polymorpha TaxID=45954 RepID=A0A9D4MUX1_DREPO|nr:hypothetical protein DPMN_007773 [Dreissena polymorpha]